GSPPLLSFSRRVLLVRATSLPRAGSRTVSTSLSDHDRRACVLQLKFGTARWITASSADRSNTLSNETFRFGLYLVSRTRKRSAPSPPNMILKLVPQSLLPLYSESLPASPYIRL